VLHRRCVTTFVRLFPLWVTLGGVVALLYPPTFTWFLDLGLITPGLQIIMLGMGLTLELDDFSRVLRAPAPIAWGVLLQYTVMPMLGWTMGYLFALPTPFAVGLVLVCCCPGGTASNVIAYLAKADVALSVSMTAVSTMLAALCTPLLTTLIVGSRVDVDGWGLFLSTAKVVLLPVAVGLFLRHYLPRFTERLLPVAPAAAVLMIVAIVAAILGAVVTAVDLPVTLKTRTGWDPDHRNGVRIARLAEDCGIRALAIHGRTRACRFAGSAEYDTIAQIVDAVDIPVIANGDIDSPEKALEVLRVTGAAAVMIGRAAQGRPWIFREVLHYLRHGSAPEPLDAVGLRAIITAHLQDLHRFYGEERGVRVARKHLSWYSRHLPDGDEYRRQVVRVESASEQLLLTERFLGSADRAGALAA